MKYFDFAGITILGLVGYGLQMLRSVSIHLLPSLSPGKNSLPRYFPISILKPLKGWMMVFDNLESFCNQDYRNMKLAP